MLFSLADLFAKINLKRWCGLVSFYPSQKLLTNKVIEAHSRWLQQNIQFEFGAKIIVQTTPTPETVVSLLWLWHQGFVVVPVKRDIDAGSLQSIADNCHASAVICNQSLRTFKTNSSQSTEVGNLFIESRPRKVVASDLALIIYTSGSTGNPKGIMLTHNNVTYAVSSIGTYLDIKADEVILGLSPLSFDYGLYQLLFCLAYDCHLVIYEESYNPIKVIKAIEEKKISLLPVVPAMAISLAKLIRVFAKELPTLKKLTNTGGHLGEGIITQLNELLPHLKIFAMYGLTECKRALYLPPKDSKKKLGSVGVAIPGLEAKVFQEKISSSRRIYQEAEVNEVGELFVRGPMVMQGYYGESDKESVIVRGQYRDDNWLATGDLFMRDEDGYFYFKGRKKELIKQAGFCIYPADIEAIVEQHESVSLVAVVAAKTKDGDECARMHVQLHENSVAVQDKFIEWQKLAIDSDYRPQEVQFIETMQLTANGKIDKQYLAKS